MVCLSRQSPIQANQAKHYVFQQGKLVGNIFLAIKHGALILNKHKNAKRNHKKLLLDCCAFFAKIPIVNGNLGIYPTNICCQSEGNINHIFCLKGRTHFKELIYKLDIFCFVSELSVSLPKLNRNPFSEACFINFC